jgi:hypothetical protein
MVRTVQLKIVPLPLGAVGAQGAIYLSLRTRPKYECSGTVSLAYPMCIDAGDLQAAVAPYAHAQVDADATAPSWVAVKWRSPCSVYPCPRRAASLPNRLPIVSRRTRVSAGLVHREEVGVISQSVVPLPQPGSAPLLVGTKRPHRLRVERDQPQPVFTPRPLADIARSSRLTCTTFPDTASSPTSRSRPHQRRAHTSPARNPVVAHSRREQAEVGASRSAAASASRTSAASPAAALPPSSSGLALPTPASPPRRDPSLTSPPGRHSSGHWSSAPADGSTSTLQARNDLAPQLTSSVLAAQPSRDLPITRRMLGVDLDGSRRI